MTFLNKLAYFINFKSRNGLEVRDINQCGLSYKSGLFYFLSVIFNVLVCAIDTLLRSFLLLLMGIYIYTTHVES